MPLDFAGFRREFYIIIYLILERRKLRPRRPASFPPFHPKNININIKYPLRKILQLKEEIEHGHSPYNSMIIGSLADLSPKSSSSSTEATLFDYKISVLTGTERIAKKLNAAFLYAKISLIRQGYYEIELKELKPSNPADENAYTIEYIKELEKNVKEQPELWMMWHRNLPLIEVH